MHFIRITIYKAYSAQIRKKELLVSDQCAQPPTPIYPTTSFTSDPDLHVEIQHHTYRSRWQSWRTQKKDFKPRPLRTKGLMPYEIVDHPKKESKDSQSTMTRPSTPNQYVAEKLTIMRT